MGQRILRKHGYLPNKQEKATDTVLEQAPFLANMDSNVVTSAGVLLGVAVAILLFRLARELYMGEQGETVWFTFSDRLIVCAALLSLVVLVLALFGVASRLSATLVPRSATLAAVVFLLGYVPSILAHYRFIGGEGRPPQRDNPEPLERILVHSTSIVAMLVALLAFLV